MRQVSPGPPHHAEGTQWVVSFNDQSEITVDLSCAVTHEEKTEERIKSAAAKYSDAHPSGVLSKVVVNLSGEKFNY